MKTCRNCRKSIYDKKKFISKCKSSGLQINEDTLEISISSGGMWTGDFSDFAKREQEKNQIREKAYKIQDKLGMVCSKCNTVYCLECVSNLGIVEGGVHGCLICGSEMDYIEKFEKSYKYGRSKWLF